MAMPTGHFQPLKDVLERLKDRGCTIRELPYLIDGPYGPMKVRYIYNLNTGDFVVLDEYDDDEMIAPSAIANIERRLGIDLGFPKGSPWIP